MNLDNEIIDATAEKNGSKKKSRKRKKTSEGVSRSKKEKQSEKSKLADKLSTKRSRRIIGAILLFSSITIFLSCLSYLFTWRADQDQVIGQGFWTYLFSGAQVPVSNTIGKLGAWISHALMYRLFGLTALTIPFLMFLLSIRVLFKTNLLPFLKSAKVCLAIVLWGSVFLASFKSFPTFSGGTFGFYMHQWLSTTIGNFGLILLLLATLYLSIVALFNPDLDFILDKVGFLKRFKNPFEEEDIKEEVSTDDVENAMVGDFLTKNTITDEEIQEEQPSKAVSFDEEEEQTEEQPLKKEDTTDDDFEIEMPAEESSEENLKAQQEESPKEDDSELDVEVPEDDETLDDKDINKLKKEFGEYDPTLDLASYVLPPIDLLRDFGSGGISVNKQELEDNKNKIVETLSNYKIDISKIKATVGPTVTLYEIIPAPGVRISKIKNLEDDIALSLSALGIRIIAPIPGKGTIGIEVPNSKPEMVSMRALIASEKFQNCDFELPVVMGKTITNETYLFDLTKMPHLLVAGATGQGKSVGLNAILVSILYKKHPAQVKFVLVDPKKVELTLYNKIERHFLAKLPGEEDAIITDTSKVVNTLNSLCVEMDERYELLKTAQARTIKEYNAKFIARRLNPEKGHRFLPYIVVLIDEFADLIMTAGKEVEHPIARIAQLARAVGIHLIVATQRPSVNVITGMIKANFPARIAFRVLSKIDSRTILDGSGADQLIGRGDMLISTGSEMKRLQCGFVDTPEVEAICDFIGDQRAYPDAMLLPEYVGEGGESKDVDMDDIDAMFADAARIVVMHQQGSASLLQRKLKLGYNRAGRIIDQLEGYGIIGPFQGSKARDVLYADENSLEEFLASKGIV